MQTERVALAALQPPPRNVRAHPEKQIAELARAIRMFGQTRPVVVDEANTVLAGNGLVAALKKLGREDAVVYRVTGLSENDKAKLLLSDNRLWELGLNDHDAIMDMIRSITAAGDFDIPGFDPASLDFGPVTVPQMGPIQHRLGRAEDQDQPATAPVVRICPHCGHRFER